MAEIRIRYLGDSVYAEIENSIIKLTTNNGEGPSNTIYLELAVLEELISFIANSQLLPEEDT